MWFHLSLTSCRKGMIEAVCPASFPPALSCVWTLSVNSILHEEVATDLLLKISQLIISVTDSRSQCPTSPCLTSTSLPVSSHWVAPKDHSLNAPHPISEMPALVPSQKPGSLPWVFPSFYIWRITKPGKVSSLAHLQVVSSSSCQYLQKWHCLLISHSVSSLFLLYIKHFLLYIKQKDKAWHRKSSFKSKGYSHTHSLSHLQLYIL